MTRKFSGLEGLYNWGSAMSYCWIVLAILGVFALGASMTVIHGYKASMLVIILGGILVQASIAALVIKFGREKSGSRRRRYRIRLAP